MSHEIRTPLNAITGFITIARNSLDDPIKVSNCIDKLEKTSQHLLSIVNDVLDMSSIEGGKLKLDSSEFDFKAMLQLVASLYYTKSQEKNILFDMMIEGLTAERVIGDEMRIKQILLNLISNAIKFTPSGGRVTVMVRQIRIHDGIVNVSLSVSDTGIGMTEEFMDRIFKPFEQADSGTAQKYGGTGLGLSITKNLVSLMSGAISVNSEANRGSVFTVDLPLGVAGTGEGPQPEDTASGLKVLVYDSRPDNRYIAEALGELKTDHAWADTQNKAIEMAYRAYDDRRGYEVCIIDHNPPASDGVQTAAMLRKRIPESSMVIALVAFESSNVEESAYASGVDFILSKPLFRSTLYDFIANLGSGNMKTDAQEAAQKPKDDGQEDVLRGKRVLLTEDNMLNMEIAVELLGMVGIEVDRAENGKISLDKFVVSQPGYYDAILMDVQMPVMDGYTAAKAIRASGHPDAARIPILAMTANAFAQDVSDSLNAGLNDHISKPIDVQQLYATLRKYVG